MFDDNTKFVAYNDLRWSGVLKAIPKSPNILQPLFEASPSMQQPLATALLATSDLGPTKAGGQEGVRP